MVHYLGVRTGVVAIALSLVLLAMIPSGSRAQEVPNFAALSNGYLLDELFVIMALEGRDHAESIRVELLENRTSRAWQMAVDRIYDPDRMYQAFIVQVENELASRPDLVSEALAFAETEVGRRVLRLEIEARSAMLDAGIDAAARDALIEARAHSSPLLALVSQRIEANDLIEANVSLGMNTSLAYYQGFLATAPPELRLSSEEILLEVLAQEPDLRRDADEWLHAYFLLAYAPLSDDALDAYIDFSASPAGQGFNTALFRAFEAVFVDVSYALGRAVGDAFSAQEL